MFQLPSKYAPRKYVLGVVGYTSSAADNGKVNCVIVDADGIGKVYLKDALTYGNGWTVSYPLKER